MKIQVSTHMTIGELQQKFKALFPALELAFFTKPAEDYAYSPLKYLISEPTTSLSRIEEKPHDGNIEIHAEMKISTLRQLFEDEFGLHVHVACNDSVENQFSEEVSEITLNKYNAKVTEEIMKMGCTLGYRDSRTEWYVG